MKQKTPKQSWAMYQIPQWEGTLGWPEPGWVCLEALLHTVSLAKGQPSVPSPGLKLLLHLVHRTLHKKLPDMPLRGWLSCCQIPPQVSHLQHIPSKQQLLGKSLCSSRQRDGRPCAPNKIQHFKATLKRFKV